MSDYSYIDLVRNFMDEDQLMYIQKGIEEGFTPEQISIYAKPEFIAEEMEVLFYGIKDGLSVEQLQLAIRIADDFWQMDDICNGFRLGISLEEMEDMSKTSSDTELHNDWSIVLKKRTYEILENLKNDYMSIAYEFVKKYKEENQVKLAPDEEALIKLFENNYIESGWSFSGCLYESDILVQGFDEKVINKLIDCGIINLRNTLVYTYELSAIERFSLLNKYNLYEHWAEKDGYFFLLNNGYNGEIHTILREVMIKREEYIKNIAVKDFVDFEISINDFVEMFNSIGYKINANTVDQLIDVMENMAYFDDEHLWNYPIEEKDYCIEEDIAVVLVKDENDSRYFEIPADCYDLIREKIVNGEIQKSKTEQIKAILVERDYKGTYERFALTPDEFLNEFPETSNDLFPIIDENTDTLNPFVHIWFKPCFVGDKEWNLFFSDMEWGLPESDIASGNLAYIREDLWLSLKEYMPINNGQEELLQSVTESLDNKISNVKKRVNLNIKEKPVKNLENERG